MFSRFDRILACDRRIDGQTSCHGIVRATNTRRAVKKSEDNALSRRMLKSHAAATYDVCAAYLM